MSVFPGLTEADPLPVGSHVCWLVNDPAAYVAGGTALLDEGKRLAQKLVLCGPAGSAAFAELLSSAKLAADALTDFLAGGQPDPSVMRKVLREQAAAARASGYKGVRLIADMDWLLPAQPGPDALAAFETHLGRIAAELDSTLICAYRLPSFAPPVITGVLAVHSALRGNDADPQFRFVAHGAGRWRLSGEIDFAVNSLFKAAFAAAVTYGDCIVDVGELKFIDLSGIRTIISTADDMGAHVELRCPPPVLRRYWQLGDFGRCAPRVNLVA